MNEIRKYLLITFFITYVFWGLTAILSTLNLYIHPTYSIGIVFYIIAVCAPAISVYIVFQKREDTRGIRYFLKNSFSIKRPVAEVSLIIIFTFTYYVVPFIFNEVSIFGNWLQVIIFTPLMFVFGGFEEIGWRGFLQPKLEAKFGFFIATLINSGIWMIWHLPLNFIQGTYQYSNGYFWSAVSWVGLAFSLATIRRIGGGVFACIFMHALFNAISSYYLSINSGLGIVVASCLQISIAMGIVAIFFKKKHIKY